MGIGVGGCLATAWRCLYLCPTVPTRLGSSLWFSRHHFLQNHVAKLLPRIQNVVIDMMKSVFNHLLTARYDAWQEQGECCYITCTSSNNSCCDLCFWHYTSNHVIIVRGVIRENSRELPGNRAGLEVVLARWWRRWSRSVPERSFVASADRPRVL